MQLNSKNFVLHFMLLLDTPPINQLVVLGGRSFAKLSFFVLQFSIVEKNNLYASVDGINVIHYAKCYL